MQKLNISAKIAIFAVGYEIVSVERVVARSLKLCPAHDNRPTPALLYGNYDICILKRITRNNNLLITQRFFPCGNRTHDTLRVSHWPSYHTNCAVMMIGWLLRTGQSDLRTRSRFVFVLKMEEMSPILNSSLLRMRETSTIATFVAVRNTSIVASKVASNAYEWRFILPPYILIFMLSISGNCLVIATLASNRRMRTITNVYLLNLYLFSILIAASIACLVGRVSASATEQGVSDSISGSGKVLLGFFRIFDLFSVVVRSLELCPVYDIRLTHCYMRFITQTFYSAQQQ
ncbi:hypothetical protein SFRURICE_006748 [Spodoptera frugiperda]|nr:hypothetical protein SFRURICE_006748 [Spodoptera frugiperda]